MVRDKNIIIGVDGSDSSYRAVSYVAELIAHQKGILVVLLHVLPPIPPELLEFGGSEDPEKEGALSKELKKDQAQWIDNAKKAAQPILERAKSVLYQVGIAPEAVTTLFSESIHQPEIVRELIEAATKQDCGTVVVGRESYSGFSEMMQRHVGEELVREGRGFAIWVIE
ncbi:MAG: universal stress protein [Nitrospirota bacterium]|nr:MAG: universal stress protein [Nitrospirota bacterium]